MTLSPSSSQPSLLSLAPELIQRILIHLFNPNPSPATFTTTLTPRNEEIFTDLYQLPSLQSVLRHSVANIEIEWTSTIPPRILSNLSNLKSLSISRHRLALAYITAVQSAHLRTLRLVGVLVPPFLQDLHDSAPNLKELSLSFITTTLDRVDGLSLEKLELTGIIGLTHFQLTGLLSKELKSLRLSYLRHSSINDSTINAIASCKNLTHLTLSHLRHCTSHSISALLTNVQGLHALTLSGTQLSSRALCNFLNSAKHLTHLSFEEPTWTSAQTQFFLRNLSNPLTSFELRDVPGATDLDMRHLVNRMHTLESLSLRRHPLLTVSTSFFISALSVKKLNLRGVFLSDQALTFLSHFALEEVSLGGDGQLVPSSLTDSIGHVSSAGMGRLLKKSPALRKFFWESPRTIHGIVPLGVDQLDARILAGMLKQYCVNLQRVEVNWLRPRVVNVTTRAEAARCDLAFLELEEATGAVVLVDERPLY